MTRSEHLAWCKQRALEYVAAGDVNQAWASMASDMRKHPDTANHIAIKLGNQMFVAGFLNSTMEMGKFIRGFN